MAKYKFNWCGMEEYDTDQLLSRMETICDYANSVDIPDVNVILAMLKINRTEDQ